MENTIDNSFYSQEKWKVITPTNEDLKKIEEWEKVSWYNDDEIGTIKKMLEMNKKEELRYKLNDLLNLKNANWEYVIWDQDAAKIKYMVTEKLLTMLWAINITNKMIEWNKTLSQIYEGQNWAETIEKPKWPLEKLEQISFKDMLNYDSKESKQIFEFFKKNLNTKDEKWEYLINDEIVNRLKTEAIQFTNKERESNLSVNIKDIKFKIDEDLYFYIKDLWNKISFSNVKWKLTPVVSKSLEIGN